MPVLESQLNPRSAEFQANAAAMRALVDDLNVQVARHAEGGGEIARAKHMARGKLSPRDRVSMLLDPGTPFLEIGPMAGHGGFPQGVPHQPGFAERKNDVGSDWLDGTGFEYCAMLLGTSDVSHRTPPVTTS